MEKEPTLDQKLTQKVAIHLRAYWKAKELSINDIAKLIGVSNAKAKHVLSSRPVVLRMEVIARICQLVGIDVSQLLADVDNEILTVDSPDDSQIAGPLTVYFDSDVYSAEETGELLSLISQLYRVQSRDRLVIDNKGVADIVSNAVVNPVGGGVS